MKKPNKIITVFLSMALFIPAGPLQAQVTINQVIETFNNGAEMVNEGSFEEAVVRFEETIRLATELGTEGDEMKARAGEQIPGLHYRMAMDKYKARDIDGAIRKFEDAVMAGEKYGNEEIKTKSENYIPQLYYVKGNSHLKADKHEEAISSFDKALEGIPDYAKAFFGKAMVYRKTGEDTRMVEMLDKAIETGKSSGDPETVEAAAKILRDYYYSEAASATKEEDYSTAFRMFLKTLEYDSEFPEPYYYMAVIYNKQLEYDKAVEQARKALELETDEEQKPRIYFELGNAYAGMVEYEKACEAFRHCLVEPFENSARHKIELYCN